MVLGKLWRSRPFAFVCAIAGGWLANAVNVPLAWILGPLLVTAGLSIVLGTRIFAPILGRRIGQSVIGAALGLAVSPSVVTQVLPYVWLMVLMPFLSIAISLLIGQIFARVSNVDHKTAFFCLVPGGLSEMASIGDRHGARREPIALAQAIRVALVVCSFPPFMVMLGWDGHFEIDRNMTPLTSKEGVAVIVLASLGVAGIRFLRFNNPWLVGALFGAAAGSIAGAYSGIMPREIFYTAQFFLGISIGSRFKREEVIRLGRFAVVSIGFAFLLAGILFVVALLMAYLSGIDKGTAALALSPGGFAEMTTTAEVLHMNVLIVTGFHISRAVIINGMSGHALQVAEWLIVRYKKQRKDIKN